MVSFDRFPIQDHFSRPGEPYPQARVGTAQRDAIEFLQAQLNAQPILMAELVRFAILLGFKSQRGFVVDLERPNRRMEVRGHLNHPCTHKIEPDRPVFPLASSSLWTTRNRPGSPRF